MNTVLKHLSTFIRAIYRMIAGTAPTTPHISASCTNINMLLMHLCDFDQERYCYILKWLAYPLRNPGARMRYGMAINVTPGTRVSLFFNQVALALHQGAGRSIDINRFRDHRKADWADAPLLLVDGGMRLAEAHIKSFITADTITVREAGKVFKTIPNRMNFIFISGSGDFLDQSDTRRSMVLDTPPPRERLFYQAAASTIKDGGVDAFRHFLMHGIDMGGFNETTIPPGFERPEHPAFNGRPLHAVEASKSRPVAAKGPQRTPADGRAA